MNKITSIIMPWRAENVRNVVAGIRLQTELSDLWLWDNVGGVRGVGEDVYFQSSKDFGHSPRFMLVGLVQTEYVYIQDDDFEITDDRLFERLIDLESKYPGYLIGHRGKIFGDFSDKQKPYQSSTGWCGEGECKTVNTGLSFFRTETIGSLPRNPYRNNIRAVTEDEYRFGDDMWLSSFCKCYATELFTNNTRPLDERGKGTSKTSGHMEVRNKLCLRYWGDMIK